MRYVMDKTFAVDLYRRRRRRLGVQNMLTACSLIATAAYSPHRIARLAPSHGLSETRRCTLAAASAMETAHGNAHPPGRRLTRRSRQTIWQLAIPDVWLGD